MHAPVKKVCSKIARVVDKRVIQCAMVMQVAEMHLQKVDPRSSSSDIMQNQKLGENANCIVQFSQKLVPQ